MCALSNDNPCTTIISCDSPTNASDEMDIITVYNELSSLVWHIPKHNIVIISGDINAQIGKDWSNKFCLHNFPNRKGEYLADFLLVNRLACLNIKYWKKEENYGPTPTQITLKYR